MLIYSLPIPATFATNFGFDPSFGEKVKIGLKFGATATTSKTVSYTVTKSLASDELGQVIVNFEDKILKSKKNLSTGRDWKPDYTDKYNSYLSITYFNRISSYILS